ncbi:calcium-binding protein [Phenylobacterium sp.]|uniref:calcium-binding protein n=1 Tax=Phenylobacterium sp. TaxID=1871053 RepID=UPI002811F987|nr:calcium-binding protein [Phenylobacterium sp.]
MEYAFETITPDQALNIKLGDTLTINGGPARAVSVTYQSYDPLALTPEVPSILVTFAGRTVKFGTGLTQLSDVGGIVMADGSKLFVGDAGSERESGTDLHDGLYGGPGDDQLSGLKGDDLLHGGSGDDVLAGGQGADSLYGGQGDDIIFGADDAVSLGSDAGNFAHGNLGDDEVYGASGADWLYGGQGNDFLAGRDGDDYLSGDLGDDELQGGLGDDSLVGGGGNDTVQGGFGADRLSGGAGDDLLVAQGPAGAWMRGDEGNDTLSSATAGQDTLYGGEGRDRFEFVIKTPPTLGQDDLIMDWEAHDTLSFAEVSILSPAAILPTSYSEFVANDYAEALRIANEHISGPGAKYVAAQVGANVIVFVDGGDPADGADTAVVLVGRTLADISLTNFV